MPRQKSIITVIRDLVREEVGRAISSLLGGLSASPKAKRGKRGPGRPPGSAKRGPGRPPGSGKRGPGRPKGSKNKPKEA